MNEQKHGATIIVTAETIHPEAAELLADYRLIYTSNKVDEATLVALCAAEHPVALLTRYGAITAAVLQASAALRVVGRHGVGLDSIDLAAAGRLGIPVLPALGSNSQAVAELTIGLVLACARRIPWLDQRMHGGHWDKDAYTGMELQGHTLGIVGIGAIGRRVADIAHAFGLSVLAADPYVPPHMLPFYVRHVPLPELLLQSDIVTLHCPLTAETRDIIGAAALGRMKRGAILVNAARNGLVDEAALIDALSTGALRAAALDCFDQEPLPPDAPIRQVNNLILTPHIAGTTDVAYRNMGVFAAQNIIKILQGQD